MYENQQFFIQEQSIFIFDVTKVSNNIPAQIAAFLINIKLIMSMTQRRWRILTLVSMTALALVVFNPFTLLFSALAIYCCYKYLTFLVEKHSEKGLIELLPQNIQNNLLNRSIFDLICDFWFFECFRFLKLLFRPLYESVQPENAIEALSEIHPQAKRKYLIKGVVRIMPDSIQLALLGHQRMRKKEEFQEEVLKENSSDKPTDDHSQKLFLKKREESQCDAASQGAKGHSRKLIGVHNMQSPKWDKLQCYNRVSTVNKQKKNVFEIISSSLNMVKRIVQMQNVGGQIRNMSTMTIIKCMVVFWVILLAQIKFNRRTRNIVIKIMYVLIGIISVFGTVGTTGMLIYKKCKEQKQIQMPPVQHQFGSRLQLQDI